MRKTLSACKADGQGGADGKCQKKGVGGVVKAFASTNALDPGVMDMCRDSVAIIRDLDYKSHDVLDTIRKLRTILSREKDPPIDEVIMSGAADVFINVLAAGSGGEVPDRTLYETAWALTNITSGSHEQTAYVVHRGVVPELMELFGGHESDNVAEQAIWALGNIAGDSVEFRDLVIEAGAFRVFAERAPQGSPKRIGDCEFGVYAGISFLRNAVWAFSNLCRRKPPPPMEEVAPLIPWVVTCLHSDDSEVLQDAAWIMAYIAAIPDSAQIIIEAGATPRLVDLMLDPAATGPQLPALQAMGNLATGSDAQTQVLINCGLIKALHSPLASDKDTKLKEACFTISNIAAGTSDQIQALCDAGIMSKVIPLIDSELENVRREAIWAVGNAISGGTNDQVRFLVSYGATKALCSYIQKSAGNPDLTKVALIALSDALHHCEGEVKDEIEECPGLDCIERLQEHPSQDVHLSAVKVLKYWE